jgi:ATP-binding cassette subfamily B protein
VASVSTGRLTALRALLGMAWRADRSTTTRIVALMLGQVVADGVVSLSLRRIVDDAVSRAAAAAVVAGVLGGLALAVAQVGGRISGNLQVELAEQVRLVLDREVLTLTASLDGLEHLERSDHLDRIMLVRQRSRALAEFGWSALGFGSLVLRLMVSLWLLATVHPALVLLGAVFAVPLLLARSGQRGVQQAVTGTAALVRLEKHLHRLCTKAAPGKEVRIARCGPELDRRAARLWDDVTASQVRSRLRAALWAASGWFVVALGYAAALLWLTALALHGRASAGDIVLVVSVAAQFRSQTTGMVGVIGKFVAGLHVLDQYQWLRRYAADRRPPPAAAALPDRLRRGIQVDGLSFRYPGTESEVLHDVTVHLPAGAIVALVGEHGAGKTTLVKLLCGFYQPTAGRILVDGLALGDASAPAWRQRTSAAFQDFGRFEFLARETVGVGDLPRIDDEPSVRRAVSRAHAGDVLTDLPHGLDTQLGKTFSGGIELSQGQWQKLALSRAFMRDAPQLLMLDEPTASLDAAAEQALFERYAERARQLGGANGAVTLLVSHRFSSVRMADLIVVIAGGTVAEQGSHEDLIRLGGRYAGLYHAQARAYGVQTPGPA